MHAPTIVVFVFNACLDNICLIFNAYSDYTATNKLLQNSHVA